MTTIYFARHQAVGVLWQYPFAAQPTDAQLEALRRLCFQQHGATHPKTKEPYWLNVIDMPLLDAATVPEVPERSLKTTGSAGAGVPETTVSGVGRVENPK